jgi:chromosome segregation ATPase
MNQAISAALYLVVLIQGAFVSGKHYPGDTPIRVTRNDRNTMVAAGVARDATEQEIQQFQGAEGVASDETSASIEAASAQLKALEDQRDEAQEVVAGLAKQRDELQSELVALDAKRTALVAEVAGLEKKAKAAKAGS